MDTMINDTALILVAILPNQRDFDIARLLGWYRIPLKSAPKVISVDYLAFYQTAAFSEADRWKISYYAKVQGHELTRRQDLLKDETDHPRAKHEYFKLAIGPLQKLPKPINAEKWRRITFFYSTGKHLLNADILTDLIVRDDEREILWRSLRERALNSNEYRADQLPEVPVDPAILALLGMINKG
ncbi:MAG: hypothetical protein MUO40_05740 [Anaerolineaceae bacterium]|nr:hypothetical protein [Anaerolineaceae bacterium]